MIAGRPNAGKSSLLNYMAGEERALVTEIAGTTRDSIPALSTIEGIPLHIIDTAGLQNTDDRVESLGIERTWQQVELADQLLFVVDGSLFADKVDISQQIYSDDLYQQLLSRLPAGTQLTVVINKLDKMKREAGSQHGKSTNSPLINSKLVNVSALTGEGVDNLKQRLLNAMGYQQHAGFSSRARHCDALNKALESLNAGIEQLTVHQSGELLAEDLRQAQNYLGDITGEVTSDDLLGKIFSSFCIGK